MGILIAVQINSWNERRSLKVLEIEILKSIHTELEEDLVDIDINIQIHENSVQSAEELIEHFESGKPYDDSLALKFYYADGVSAFLHSTSAFETLKAQGVQLISNETLRNQIIRLYDGQYNGILGFENNIHAARAYRINEIWPGRFEEANKTHFPLTVAFTEGEMVPIDFEALRNDSVYQYHLRNQRNMNRQYLGLGYYAVREEIFALTDAILSEIQRLSH